MKTLSLFLLGALLAGVPDSPARAAKPVYLEKVRAYVDAKVKHLAWDVLTDAPLESERDTPHEFQRPWVFWEKSFQLAPANTKRFADCL